MAAAAATQSDDTIISVTRVFDAPRERVWKATSDPALMDKWWGNDCMKATIVDWDMRPNGKWRIEHRGQNGETFTMYGEFLEVNKPARVTHTQRFLDYPPAMVTVDYDDLNGKTRLTTRIEFASAADCAGAKASGMEQGMTQSFEQLAKVINTL